MAPQIFDELRCCGVYRSVRRATDERDDARLGRRFVLEAPAPLQLRGECGRHRALRADVSLQSGPELVGLDAEQAAVAPSPHAGGPSCVCEDGELSDDFVAADLAYHVASGNRLESPPADDVEGIGVGVCFEQPLSGPEGDRPGDGEQLLTDASG